MFPDDFKPHICRRPPKRKKASFVGQKRASSRKNAAIEIIKFEKCSIRFFSVVDRFFREALFVFHQFQRITDSPKYLKVQNGFQGFWNGRKTAWDDGGRPSKRN